MVELTTGTRIDRPAVAVAWLVAFIGGFSAIGMARQFPPAVFLGPALAVLAGVMLARLSKSSPPGVVRIDTQGLTIGGALVMPRAEIADAQFVPIGRDGPHVVIKGKRKLATIMVSGPEQAAQILQELGMDVGAHAAEFAAVAPSPIPVIAGIVLGLGLMMVGLFSKTTPLVILGPILAILAPILLVPATLRVGTDGLHLKSRLKEKFFPLERIASVAPTRNGIELAMIDGSRANLPIASSYQLSPYDKELQAALLQRIHEVQKRRTDTASSSEATVGWRLGRGERTIADWLASLVGEGGDDGGFRDAEIRLDDLVEVLDDRSGAPAHERVAAAVLLAKRGGDEDRARIRVAAEAVVAPKLRVALDAIADGKDVAALEEAIREAEEEDVKQRASSA